METDTFEYKQVKVKSQRVPLPPSYGTPGESDRDDQRSQQVLALPSEEKLNGYGAEGWELVQILLVPGADAYNMYFKRRLT